ncbi:hypothetical protein D9V32_06790 [Mycetocola tolaasinivorans]|uniref:Uncharacterized protein n=1 Tax=Mycetocola tolaasinivorans TaxID=76635 RepID=A0A3L7A9N4_9MICO|nr:hypothetical protein [Mycetocola tolaasinivorans]RLP76550.1 hypothetical protein D9V32_06790 [Mycetocola tolaasinivorans]
MSVLPTAAVSDVFAWSLEVSTGVTSVVSVPLPPGVLAAHTPGGVPESVVPTRVYRHTGEGPVSR